MRLTRPALWAVAALLVAGCDTSADALLDSERAVGVDRIEMRDNAFDPQVVEVPAGTTVTWVFSDGDRRHNVVGDDFESDVASDGTFPHTFPEPGTYDYRCTLHSGMDGRVVVTES